MMNENYLLNVLLVINALYEHASIYSLNETQDSWREETDRWMGVCYQTLTGDQGLPSYYSRFVTSQA